MKLKSHIEHLLIVFSLIIISSCGNDSEPPLEILDAQLHTENGIAYVGGEYFLNITSNGSWKIEKNDAADWYSFSQTSGQGNTTVILVISGNNGAIRTSSFDVVSGTVRKNIQFNQSAFSNDATYPKPEAYNLEVPRLSNDILSGKSTYVTHYANDLNESQTLNYSFEYNYGKHHTKWVAFSFDINTAKWNTSRSDAWAPDPLLTQYTDNGADYSGSGYTRGHLVASADRLYSKQANEQTFYYSNISPQTNNFNTGIWADLEIKVRAWVPTQETDTLFVTKGGTINDGQILGTIGANKIAIPKYYFMAFLYKKGSTYKSIAFYFEHKAYSQPYNQKIYALTVDELEIKTGIDFFHNLPNDIEFEVEKQKNLADWPGL